MTTKLSDALHLHGHITIESVDKLGKRLTLLDEENLIVTSGRMSLANQLAHATGSGLSIYDIAFGNAGVLVNNPAAAIGIDPTETVLAGPIANLINGSDYYFSIASVPTKVVCSITVPTASTLNGQPLSELALMLGTSASTLTSAFSIKRFPSIYKSDTISLVITWTIYL